MRTLRLTPEQYAALQRRNAGGPNRKAGFRSDSPPAPAPTQRPVNVSLPKLVDTTIHKPKPAPALDFPRLCAYWGIPEPQAEFRFHPKRRWRFDWAFLTDGKRPRRLALEIEGGIWTNGRHTRGAGAKADLEKYSEAAILGWRIVYCTPAELVTVGMDRVKRALGIDGPEAA